MLMDKIKIDTKIIDFTSFTIQTFDDSKQNHALAQIFKFDPLRIEKFNRYGAGVYFCINPQVDPTKRLRDNTSALQRIALDLDVCKEQDELSKDDIDAKKIVLLDKLKKLEIPPNFIIESKNGWQPIWEFTNPTLLSSTSKRLQANEFYNDLIRGFATKTDLQSEGDNICRVVRLPGTYHLKNPNDPFKIKITTLNLTKPTLEEFIKTYPPVPKATQAQTVTIQNTQSSNPEIEQILKYPVTQALEKLSGSEAVDYEQFSFSRNSNGTLQIVIDSKPSGQWIDVEHNTIGGSGRGQGNPSIIQFVQWYGINRRKEDERTAKGNAIRSLKHIFGIGKSPESKHQIIKIPNVSEFTKQDFGTTAWQVDGVIPYGGSVIIVAKRESYKTWFALYLASCISKGEMLWNTFGTKQDKILYISNDDPARNFQSRLVNFDFDNAFFVYHSSLPPFSVDQDDDSSFLAVKNLIKQEKINVLIIDILRNTHNKDSNSDKEAKQVFDKYKEFRQENQNLVFVFLIHPSKEQAFEKKFSKRQTEEAIGSYYWEASVDTVLSLTKSTDDNLTDSVVFHVTKNKQSDKKIKPFVGIRRKHESQVEFIYEESIPDKLKIEEAKEFILNLLATDTYNRQGIITVLKDNNICGSRITEEALKQLNDANLVTHTTKKPHIYSLSTALDDNSALRNTNNILRTAESSDDVEQLIEDFEEDEKLTN